MSREKFMEEEHKSGFVALVGPANAGKSTLLNALLGTKVSIVSPKPQTTRNRIFGIKNGPDYQMVFLDTPGFLRDKVSRGGRNRALGKVLRQSLHDAVDGVDVCALVVDGCQLLKNPEELNTLTSFFEREHLLTPHIIVVNKIDLVDRKDLLPLLRTLYDTFVAKEEGRRDIEIIPISARKADGLQVLERTILSRLQPGVKYFPEGQVTNQSDEFLAAEVVREKLFYQLSDELPYSLAVQIERWEEAQGLLRLSAVITVERESQKGIVIGVGGEKLKMIGTAARKELERIFGTKVFLELFVRVEENWTRTEAGLRRVGFARG